MKILRIILLLPIGLIGITVLIGWILALSQFDISDESFKRDYYKSRLEGMKEYQCLCNLFNEHQFSGKVSYFNSPLGKGSKDEIVIELDKSSDSIFLQNTVITDILGDTNFYIHNNKMFFKIGPGKGPNNLNAGDWVNKSKSANEIIFTRDTEKKSLNPYIDFVDIYSSCKELDTMNVIYNYNEFLKFDSLSRVSKPIDAMTKKYLKEKFKIH